MVTANRTAACHSQPFCSAICSHLKHKAVHKLAKQLSRILQPHPRLQILWGTEWRQAWLLTRDACAGVYAHVATPGWRTPATGINCIDAVPIAIHRGTFCNAFLGQVCHEHQLWQSQRWRLSLLYLRLGGPMTVISQLMLTLSPMRYASRMLHAGQACSDCVKSAVLKPLPIPAQGASSGRDPGSSGPYAAHV